MTDMQRPLAVKRDPALGNDRTRAIAALDMDWARRMFPGAPETDLLQALHKARYHADDMPANLRAESARWLHDRGLRDALGLPIDLSAIPTFGRGERRV